MSNEPSHRRNECPQALGSARPRPDWTRLVASCVVVIANLAAHAMGHDFHEAVQEPHETGHAGVHGQVDEHAAGASLAEGWTAVVVSSELVVGPNRFAVGLLDAQGVHVQRARVHFRYFDLRIPTAPVLESEAGALPLTTPDGFTTIFAHERAFAWEGPWGVEIQVLLPDGRIASKGIAFQVTSEGAALAPGERVPLLQTPTDASVAGDLSRLSSALEPNPDLYRTSLADAVSNGRPTALLFATPGFCRTRFCGPSYTVLTALQKRYGNEADFIHVEIFSGMPDPAADDWQLAPAVLAFGLRTEPWLYLVDTSGAVVYRVEGMFTEHEVEVHLLALLGR